MLRIEAVISTPSRDFIFDKAYLMILSLISIQCTNRMVRSRSQRRGHLLNWYTRRRKMIGQLFVTWQLGTIQYKLGLIIKSCGSQSIRRYFGHTSWHRINCIIKHHTRTWVLLVQNQKRTKLVEKKALRAMFRWWAELASTSSQSKRPYHDQIFSESYNPQAK